MSPPRHTGRGASLGLLCSRPLEGQGHMRYKRPTTKRTIAKGLLGFGTVLAAAAVGAVALLTMGAGEARAAPPQLVTCELDDFTFDQVTVRSAKPVQGGDAIRLRLHTSPTGPSQQAVCNDGSPGVFAVAQAIDVVLGFSPGSGSQNGEIKGRTTLGILATDVPADLPLTFRGRMTGQGECVASVCALRMPFQAKGKEGASASGVMVIQLTAGPGGISASGGGAVYTIIGMSPGPTSDQD